MGVFVSCKMFFQKIHIFWKLDFQKRKMYSGCLAVSEIVLWKINSGVWFVQIFYGNRFTENQFWCLVRPNILRKMLYGKSIPMFGSIKHFTKNEIRFFTENQFWCLVCGSFYGKYEMCYKFKHLHYLDKPVTVQN